MSFEKATRQKLRFQTAKGQLSVEDLWDLSLDNLNTLAKSLHKQTKESVEVDFLGEQTKEDEKLKLQFDIVLHVLNTKKAEQKARLEAADRKAERERIQSIIARKQDEALENLSLEELKAKEAALI